MATLGTTMDEQKVDGLEDEYSKKFMLDYNFPPFCVGETKPLRGPGRREIGHGALAERALAEVLPPPRRAPFPAGLRPERGAYERTVTEQSLPERDRPREHPLAQ